MATAGIQLTDQQRLAIETRDVSIALSAGAGCGKTFVLTERYLSHVAPGTTAQPPGERLGRVVAITFTDRAAREMRQRIRRHSHERLQAAAGRDQQQQWLELLRQLDAARVSTIHSFCATLLRSSAVEIGLDPQFDILDRTESDRVIAEVTDDVLRRRLSAQDDAVLDLVERFGLKSLRELIRLMLSARHEIDFDAWSQCSPDELVGRWRALQISVVQPAVVRRLSRSPAAAELLRLIRRQAPLHPKMIERCAVLLDLLPRLEDSKNPLEDVTQIRANATVQYVHKKKGWPTEETHEQFKTSAKALRDLIDKQIDRLAWDEDAARLAAAAGLQLLDAAGAVIEEYETRKKELGLLDQDDLLILARDLLCRDDDAARRRIGGQIDMLLVDEFQDTDRLQVELVKALCGSALTQGKLFFVGDRKQSIYRFRGAEPDVFRDLREALPAAGRLPLSHNFRSQPAILHFVNALFCDELGPEYEPLVSRKTQVTATPAVEFLWAPAAESDVATMRSTEADWIARRIRAMLDGQEALVYDEDQGAARARSVRPGDVALLFRAMSDVQYYEAALESHGIDYYVVGGHAFYSQQEVFDLLNLLRAVDDRLDEVSLAGALRSPLFGLTDETLFWLADHPQGLSAGLFAKALPEELAGQQRERAAVAADTIDWSRRHKDRLPIAALINELLARTGYDATLLGEFLGARKLANLYKLIERARRFDSSGIFTLADFTAQLADSVTQQPREAPAATQAENADVVRLMTIHQAKGLEFPVVVVPDIGRRVRPSNTNGAFSAEWGPLVSLSGEKGTIGLDLYKMVQEAEDDAERSRLLYVATTRAADYLILSSAVDESGKYHGPWKQLLARRFDLHTGRLLANLPEGYCVPEVRVTDCEPPARAPASGASPRRRLAELLSSAESWTADGPLDPPASVLPVLPDKGARRRFSFSALSGQLHATDPGASQSESTDEPAAAPATDPLRLGTLVHDVLEAVPFDGHDDVAARVRRHAQSQTGCTAAEIHEATELVSTFLTSQRARALTEARLVHRELEFLLAWPPGEPREEGVYLEGFIDCLLQDQHDRWHVLDYKTNVTTAERLAETAAPYQLQMHVYALAVRQVLSVEPATLTLHFLRPGAEFQFTWNDAARRDTIDQVNRLLAEVVS